MSDTSRSLTVGFSLLNASGTLTPDKNKSRSCASTRRTSPRVSGFERLDRLRQGDARIQKLLEFVVKGLFLAQVELHAGNEAPIGGNRPTKGSPSAVVPPGKFSVTLAQSACARPRDFASWKP